MLKISSFLIPVIKPKVKVIPNKHKRREKKMGGAGAAGGGGGG